MKLRHALLAALLLAVLPAAGQDSLRVFLIGDSTCATKELKKQNPERGWGHMFAPLFDASVTVENHAVNGRSTKSFRDEGRWDVVLSKLRPGDYVFIQFGHNDQKIADSTRYASPADYAANLRRYVREARERGAEPVLLTSVVRRRFVDGELTDTHGEYPAAVRRVAAEECVPLLDMEPLTREWVSSLGDEASKGYFMWVEPGTCAAIPDGRQDDTHSNARGARRNCEIVCDSIRVKLPALAGHLVHYDYVVDQHGRGDFLTVQEAIDAVPDYRRRITTILIKPGIYHERIIIPAGKCRLKISGRGADRSVISWDNAARKLWPDAEDEIGTSGSASVFVNASNVTFEDIGIRNDAGSGDIVGQAVALMTAGDCLFFHRCHIFGPGTCVFENCEILSKKNSYITAASTVKGEDYGYVFIGCRLTAAPGVDKVHLGRPWRDHAKVVWIGCEMGGHIRPEGWHNWNRPEREKTAYYAEYGCTGPGARTDGRVKWSHRLTARQAEAYSFERIMSAERYGSLWNPFDNR